MAHFLPLKLIKMSVCKKPVCIYCSIAKAFYDNICIACFSAFASVGGPKRRKKRNRKKAKKYSEKYLRWR